MEVDTHINDPIFAKTAVNELAKLMRN